MGALELVRLNLLSPMVLAFALGIILTMVKSDLKFPEELYTALSIYLLLAIGLKGGVALSATPLSEFIWPALVTLGIGVAVPLWSYVILRRLGKFDIANAAAIAAHYGSVSAVTFITAQSFLTSIGENFEGYVTTLLALLEVPAIIVGLLIANMGLGGQQSWSTALHEIVTGKSIALLIGGLIIGLLAGQDGFDLVAPFFVAPFNGVLTIFLLEMGLVTARRLRDLRKVGFFLIGFGIVMPVLHGLLGVWLAQLVGMSVGGATVLGTMAASASYIAAPAAVRIALPQANPSYYLTASLGITFPFNLIVGIPLYFAVAQLLAR